MTYRLAPILTLLALAPVWGQDERRVASPDGQIEFRLRIAQPENGALFRLAYQIFYRGKPLIDTSFLGLNIRNQEPILGENVGLTASHISGHSLVAEYMQNGSIGRRINVEARVADDGVAFRYVIPRSTPLDEILIDDELTEFALPNSSNSRAPLVFVTTSPLAGWIAMPESNAAKYPAAHLELAADSILITRLAAPFEGVSPLTCPWRFVIIAASRDR